jgi:hypothetical protein
MLDKSKFTEAEWLAMGFELQSKADDTKRHYETRLAALRRTYVLISLGILLLSVGVLLTSMLGPSFITLIPTALGGVVTGISTAIALDNAKETGTSHYRGSFRHKADQAQRELNAYYMADSSAAEFKTPKAAIEPRVVDNEEVDRLRRINNSLVEKNAMLNAKVESLRGRIISDQKNSIIQLTGVPPRQLRWQELEDITDGFGNTIAVRGVQKEKRSIIACNQCDKFMSGSSRLGLKDWSEMHYTITGHLGYSIKDV